MPLSATSTVRVADQRLFDRSFAQRIDDLRYLHVWDLAIVSTRAGFDALESEWNALFERSGQGTQMFQTFNWLWHWCNHFAGEGSGVRLFIVTARRNGRLVLVWPLALERAGLATKLTWMGEPVSQYGDVVMEPSASSIDLLRASWNFIIEETNASVVQLRKVRADAAVAPLMRELGLMEIEHLTAPYLNLADAPSFAEYEKRYSASARKNRRRQRRRIEDHGPMRVDFHRGGAVAGELAVAAIALKRAWLRDRGLISPALSDERTARFFAEVAEARQRPAGCHVVALISNGKPAALEVGIRVKGRSGTHIIVYDPEFEKHSAGAVLMEDSIRGAFDHGIDAFDLLAPGDGYKLEWADAATRVSTFVAPLNAVGQVYARLYLGLARPALKKLMNLLPISVRRPLAG
jgi:CelD/BcsL family acetyltransferase involved in cellulose biosynthesis